MPHLSNLVRVYTATVGAGAVTLGAAVPGFLTFVQGAVPDGATVSYGIREGNNSETGRGVYTLATQTLTRVPNASTNGGAAIVLAGAAELFITGLAEDFLTDAQVAALHPRQHAITSALDHTSAATPGQMLQADANGLPVDATNTDAQVSAAVTASHAAVTLAAPNSGLSLLGQVLSLGTPDTLTSTSTNAVTLATHTHAITASAGLVGNGTAQYQVLTTGANPYPAAFSDFFIRGTTGGTTNLAVTNTQPLTLTATDDYNITFPATGTVALLATANVFTVNQTVNGSTDTAQLAVTGHTTQTGAVATVKRNDGATNTQGLTFTVGANSTGTPTTSFGVTQNFTLESSTTADQLAAKIDVLWATATHASRKARMVLSAYDTAAREGIRIEADGAAAMLGFYGTSAVAKQGSTIELGTMLATLGLRTSGIPFFVGNYANYSQAIAYASTINWDMNSGSYATVTLTGDATIANPTNLIAGSFYVLKLTQDATGNRKVKWGTAFKWAEGVEPILQTAASGIDLFGFFSDGTNLFASASFADYQMVMFEDEVVGFDDGVVFA